MIVAALRKLNLLLHKMDRLLGRRIYGVDTTLSRGIRGGLYIVKTRKRAGVPLPGNAAFGLADLDQNGFLRLPESHVQGSVIAAIGKQVAGSMADREKVRPRGSADPLGNYYGHEISDVLSGVPDLERIFTDELHEFLQAHFRAHITIPTVRVYRTAPVPETLKGTQEFFADGWHWDQRFTSMLKMFYLVHDTDEDCGPFHFLSLPDSTAALRAGYLNRYDYGGASLIFENSAKVRKFTGAAGSTMLCNTTCCAHRAGHPAPGRTRDMAMFHILPSDTPLPDNWFELASSAVKLGQSEYK